MRRFFLIIWILAALFVVGCGSGGSSTESNSSEPFRITTKSSPIRYEKTMHVNKSGFSGEEPKAVIPKSPPPEFLALTDLVEGIGRLYTEGDTVTVQWVAYDYETGKKVTSSWEQGKPVTFTLGKGEVIQGWEEGLEGLEGGDRRELVVPPELTRGSNPAGIPQGKTIVFVVEAVPRSGSKTGNSSPPTPSGALVNAPKRSKPKVTVPPGTAPKNLVVDTLIPGKGPAAKPGDEVIVQYVGVLFKNGKEFDSSWEREPFLFHLGFGEVIKGWDKGMNGMKVGERRELIIPPRLAYGSQPVGSIPPNETLVFVIDLLAIR